jgi:hypothetical protein
MTTKAKAERAHTPLPWSVSGLDKRYICHLSDNGTGMPRSMSVARLVERISETEANAEFIVRAVNSHDELVAVVEVTLRALTNPGPGTPSHSALLTQLRAALAKAKA